MPILPRVPPESSSLATAKTWAPVSYTSEVTGLGAGETLPFPQVSLQSGFNTPYLVDEIRLTAYTGAYTLASVTIGDISSILSYQLGAGKYLFSQGGFGQTPFVPMILYAPTYSGGGHFENMTQAVTGGTDARRFSTRRWVLPKPLYMPAGDAIVASVARDSVIGTSIPDITAQVTVIGRALPPDTQSPAIRQIPYVGYYIHPSTATFSEGNFQLQNPFNSDWNVQRLILATRNATANNGVVTGAGFYENSGTIRFASLKLSDSLGYKITGSSIGGFIPIGDIASVQTDAAWTFSRPLPPGEQYNATFQITTGSVTNTEFDVLLGLVGYRDEGP